MTMWSRMSDLRERIVLAVLDSLEDGDPVVEIGIMPSGGWGGVEVGDVMARARAAGDCCDHGGSIVFEESLFEGELYAWRNVCAECGEVMASGGR